MSMDAKTALRMEVAYEWSLRKKSRLRSSRPWARAGGQRPGIERPLT